MSSLKQFGIMLQMFTVIVYEDTSRECHPAFNGKSLWDFMQDFKLAWPAKNPTIEERVARWMLDPQEHWRNLVSYDMHLELSEMEKEALDFTYRFNHAITHAKKDALPLHKLKHMMHPDLGEWKGLMKYKDKEVETLNRHMVYIPCFETLYLFDKL